MKTQWMIYKELEQIPDSVPEPRANQVNPAAWLSGIWRTLINTVVSEPEPQGWESLERVRTWWNVYDPVSGQLTCLPTEQEVRAWLELCYYPMDAVANDAPETGLETIMKVHHFTLHKGELLQVPRTCRRLRVLSGVAWVTVARQDIVLSQGQEASLCLTKNSAVVSVLGKTPVVLEIQGRLR